MKKTYNTKLKVHSRALRTNMTEPEVILWSLLRRKQIHGIMFTRQKPILNYIVDFYAPEIKLVIELDGSQHYIDDCLKDKIRDYQLSALGITVIRFSNLEIYNNLTMVLDCIYLNVEKHINFH